MAAHGQVGVAEGDMRVDLAIHHESGDREDVKRSFSPHERVPWRHVRGLHDVKVIAIERTNSGQDGGVLNAVVPNRLAQREEYVLTGIES
jgi:hypothetical protein